MESAKDCKSVAITTTHNLAVREDSKEEGARQRRKEMVCPQRRVIPPYGPINGGSIPPPSTKIKVTSPLSYKLSEVGDRRY